MLKGTRERLFARVHANVIDKLVFGLERFAVPAALLPKARVVRALWPAHVIHSNVRHNLLHCRELFQTRRAHFELLTRLRSQQRLCVQRALCADLRSVVVMMLLLLMMLMRLLLLMAVSVMMMMMMLMRLVRVHVMRRVWLLLRAVHCSRERGSVARRRVRVRVERRAVLARRPIARRWTSAPRLLRGRLRRRLSSGRCLRCSQLGLLLLLHLERQLDPQTSVRAHRLAFARALVRARRHRMRRRLCNVLMRTQGLPLLLLLLLYL